MKIISTVVLILLSTISAKFVTQKHAKCGQNNAGKLIEMERESYKMYKICVNPHQSETYYVYHKLGYQRRHSKKNYICLKSPQLRTTEYSKIADVFNNQRIHFDGNHFFTPLQLAPCEDFSDQQEKSATFFVENMVPSFSVILNGNWAFIEESVRRKVTEETEIITGQFGHLTLPDRNGENISLFLEDSAVGQTKNSKQPYNRVKVPEFFYKIVRSSNNDLVFVTSNNPFMTSLADEKRMCKVDVCSTALRLKNFSLGYTYCCHFAEFAMNLKLKHNIEFAGVIGPSTESSMPQDFNFGLYFSYFINVFEYIF